MSAPEVRTVACPSWQVEAIWPIAEPFVARSYRKASQTVPKTLLADLAEERRTLWLVISGDFTITGAGITAIYDLADGRMCKIEHFGGDDGRRGWIDQRAVIEQYARDQGCDRVMIEGRLGWQRVLTDYETTAVILEKRL